MLPLHSEQVGTLAWWPPKQHYDGEERALPQTFDEWLTMDRRQFGGDGTEIGIVSMMRDERNNFAMSRVITWFEAFFYPVRVRLHDAVVPRFKPKSTRKVAPVNYEGLLEQIQVPNVAMAVVGITDLDNCFTYLEWTTAMISCVL